MPARGQTRPKPVPGDPADPRGLCALITAFLEHLAVTGYSPRSVTTRRITLSAFVLWCEERGISRPAEITKPILERYQSFLYHYRKESGEPLGFRSQRSRLDAVRALFKWLARNNYLLGNPASDLTLPRLPRRLPKCVLTLAEAEKVLGQPDLRTPLGIRDRAILETFFSTGMRRMELAGLKLTDLDLERGTVLIRLGKGKKDRMIPIGARAIVFVEKYLRDVRPELVQPPDDGALFLTATGHPFTPDVLTNVCRQHVEEAEIGKKGACHLFRHTMATLMLEGGADIRFIQAMLGHSSLSTTEIYTQVSIKKLQEIHAATHPGAKLPPPLPSGGGRVDPGGGEES